MRTPLVSPNFEIPKQATIDKYRTHPITVLDVDEDLQALLANAEFIVKQRGGETPGGWPHRFTREENYKDLAWLETCARLRQLFCYILRDEKSAYSGCVYIYPIELYYPDLADKFDVDFSFWLVGHKYKKGEYEKIFKALFKWLTEKWMFPKDRIYLRNKEIPTEFVP